MSAAASAAVPGVTAPARLPWADAIKGVLIVLVVFWHVVLKTHLQVDWQLGLPIPGVWGLASDAIWPFLMPLFLLVSGFFAAGALNRPWRAVWRGRVIRFVYLYLLWSLIHAAAMAAFPDFPTLVPRDVAQFVEAVTISPPNTWYLYALALYFVVAKGLSRVPRVVTITLAGMVAVLVTAGAVNVVSNRGSLMYNLLFFLLGAYGAAGVRCLVAAATTARALIAVGAYAVAFGAMRLTGAEEVPGVWPLVSCAGIVMGLLLAGRFAGSGRLARGAAWLGARTLPVYLIHMPLLALADAALGGWLSGSRVAVQLVAAVVLPVVLTAALVAASAALGGLMVRDRLSWLFDLPSRGRGGRGTWGWRTAAVLVVLVAVGALIVRAPFSTIAGCATGLPRQAAVADGEVSIGATGDVLLHDVGHRVPADGGAAHFAAVRPWFTQDIVTGNLEQVVADDTGFDKCGERSDCLAFRSDAATAPFFAGFDLMNLANNHTSDFGADGYTQTRVNLAEAGIRTVGDRDEIACTRVGDITVATIGFAPYGDTNRLTDLRHTRRVVEAAARTADVVVVHAHMGAEGPDADAVAPGMETMFGERRGDVTAFAHAAVDAGADLVIGHGPHVLRGMEVYRGRLVAYSLGNFGGGGVFGAEQATRYGGYLEVALDRSGELVRSRLRSVDFDAADGIPRPDAAQRALALIDERSRRDFPLTAPRFAPDGTLTPPAP